MDVFNPDTWKQQWTAFMSAPYIIMLFIVGAGLIGWWLRGIKSESKIDSLEGRLVISEDRLKFAGEKVTAANEAKDDVIRQFQAYRAEVAANAGNSTLAATAAKLEIALEKFSTANKAVGRAVGILETVEIGDTIHAEVIRADNEPLNDNST